jgi:hypothetical protein
VGVRAHPGDRHVAGARHQPPSDPSNDPPGERDQRADRLVFGIAFGALRSARVSQINFTVPVGRLIVFLIAS